MPRFGRIDATRDKRERLLAKRWTLSLKIQAREDNFVQKSLRTGIRIFRFVRRHNFKAEMWLVASEASELEPKLGPSAPVRLCFRL